MEIAYITIVFLKMNSPGLVEQQVKHGDDVSKNSSEVRRENESAPKSKASIRIFVRSSPSLLYVDSIGGSRQVATALYPALPFTPRRATLIKTHKLEPKQEAFLNEVKSLAKHLGAKIEIRDLGRQNIIQRLFSRISVGNISVPSVFLSGANMTDIERELASSYLGTELNYTKSESRCCSHLSLRSVAPANLLATCPSKK